MCVCIRVRVRDMDHPFLRWHGCLRVVCVSCIFTCICVCRQAWVCVGYGNKMHVMSDLRFLFSVSLSLFPSLSLSHSLFFFLSRSVDLFGGRNRFSWLCSWTGLRHCAHNVCSGLGQCMIAVHIHIHTYTHTHTYILTNMDTGRDTCHIYTYVDTCIYRYIDR